MRKSIKKMVTIRVAVALLAVLLFSVMMTINILSIQHSQEKNAEAAAVLDRVQRAETAHYKWSANLSNALYANSEFTGSTDPTTCVLGQWLYGEAGTDNAVILQLRNEMEPLHKELHESAILALEQYRTNPATAQNYYQNTILKNLSTLVGKLDSVVEESAAISAENAASMERTITMMHFTSVIGLSLSLIALISLILYVINKVLRPILQITEDSRPLQEGRLELTLNYQSDDELGDLSRTLKESMARIEGYVTDINEIMSQLSDGNFDVHTSTRYIGDFQSIEESINSFTSNISNAFGHIQQAEQKVSGNAEQLSSSSQSLAQGATEQASEVEGLYATLDQLSKSAAQNVRIASEAQEGARLTGEQVTISSQQMDHMVSAMRDITESSQQISRIIATIENIAFQTNILALNAAVEAARAGAAGKGFAVVSDEVRSLATQSDQAAKATKELIENSVKATQRGSAIVDEVSQSLQKTMSLVMESNAAIGAIAQAVQSEADSITQVADGLGQISSVVQTNSASSEESAAVSAELFEQVHLLQAETRRFRLKQ
ncbi:MAG: HAMP domain-containing protein [Angelakisella sp.]|jgi:methyl-accepting chemotaxis protein|nr:HAMP domain-containing protein [Angelakisella sp.]